MTTQSGRKQRKNRQDRPSGRDWLYRRGGVMFALIVIVACIGLAFQPSAPVPSVSSPETTAPHATAAVPDVDTDVSRVKRARIVVLSGPRRPVEQPPSSWRWEQQAIAFPVEPETPLIAIVLDDMGLDRRRLATAMALKKPVTLAFLAYADGLQDMAQTARDRGHEVLLHLPMEPRGDADPGPGALLMDLAEAELRSRIHRGLNQFSGFLGVNNHMGSRFTADPIRMGILFDVLRSTGHLYLDSFTTPESVAIDLGREVGVPTVRRDVFLDNIDDGEAIRRQLARARTMAMRTGTAIAIGHPRDTTLSTLADWIARHDASPARLVPLSAVAGRRFGTDRQIAAKP